MQSLIDFVFFLRVKIIRQAISLEFMSLTQQYPHRTQTHTTTNRTSSLPFGKTFQKCIAFPLATLQSLRSRIMQYSHVHKGRKSRIMCLYYSDDVYTKVTYSRGTCFFQTLAYHYYKHGDPSPLITISSMIPVNPISNYFFSKHL